MIGVQACTTTIYTTSSTAVVIPKSTIVSTPNETAYPMQLKDPYTHATPSAQYPTEQHLCPYPSGPQQPLAPYPAEQLPSAPYWSGTPAPFAVQEGPGQFYPQAPLEYPGIYTQ